MFLADRSEKLLDEKRCEFSVDKLGVPGYVVIAVRGDENISPDCIQSTLMELAELETRLAEPDRLMPAKSICLRTP